MELEFNKKELIDNPNLSEHIIKYVSETFANSSRMKNYEFKGFVEFDFDIENTCYGYYGHNSLDNKNIYLSIVFFEFDKELESESMELLDFINNKKREYNRNSKNNVEYTTDEIKDLFFNDIDLNNLDKYFKDYKYIIFLEGCDDGHKFIRFNSLDKREDFIETILSFNKYEDLFNYENDSFLLFNLN